MIVLNKLEEITNIRSVWPHEAVDFTPWLAEDDNIGLLSDAIGIDITVDDTESPVGDFSVDIFAKETGTDRKIIIENQLEDTNHDHLGKLITYASGKDAEVVVWVVKHSREEHKSAIEWLNNHTDESVAFFLVEVKLYRIGDSAPAVKFEVVERPNDWSKSIKRSEAYSATEQFRYEYWSAFNEYAFAGTAFSKEFNRRKPGHDHWMDLSIGSSDYHISILLIRKNSKVGLEFYISDDKELYRKLYEKRTAIEQSMGVELDWRELPERKASRILAMRECDISDRTLWKEQFDWIIDTAIKMKKTFKRFV